MPAPVVVTKDVGGTVVDYQAQTARYRLSGREVKLHECRSACTMALSLPNVCVYPDSTLKFHLAYDPRNHQTNTQVSQELFNSYPGAVRARLGALTRDYKVLRGSELIALGIRNCNEPRTVEPNIMVASPAAPPRTVAAEPGAQRPLLAGLMDKMLSVFGAGEATSMVRPRPILPTRLAPEPDQAKHSVADIPLPPPRPAEFMQRPTINVAVQAPAESPAQAAGKPKPARPEAAGKPLPPLPPADAAPSGVALAAARPITRRALPKIITGAQPILPPGFSAYAELGW
jgi:hypothetical protein